MPVELPELKARDYFSQLIDAVSFLHRQGCSHNDIKPANILLSSRDMPVLVDFGFAHMYDLTTDEKFMSNLSWGTPEYLPPER
jgi:serine/threonine protein kinase